MVYAVRGNVEPLGNRNICYGSSCAAEFSAWKDGEVPHSILTLIGRRSRWELATYAAACVAFAYFFIFRLRHIGACDWSSYYIDSLRFRGIDALHLDPSVPVKGPLAPLCMNLVDHDNVVSIFPPGFPLLLALTGALGFAFAMNPLIGALSGVTLYHLIKPRVPGPVAFLMTVMWFSSPLVFYGATQLMSDLPATEFCMLSVLALEGELPLLAGVVLGAAVGIRPACILMAPALVALSPRVRSVARLALGGFAAVACWALLLRAEVGNSPVPYAINFSQLTGSLFASQLWFLLSTLAGLHVPQFLLAVLGVAANWRRSLPFVLWLASFTLFHAIWRTPYTDWWWTRYVLPALPAVFVLAAEGAALAWRTAAAARSNLQKGGVAAIAVAYGAWSYFASPATYGHTTTLWRSYQLDSERVAKLVHTGTLVGAVNYSGPLRFYGGVQSFFLCHPDSRALVDWALGAGREVLGLMQPNESDCGSFEGRRLTSLESLDSGAKLFRVERAPSQKLDLGSVQARRHLINGWSPADEQAGDVSFVWAVGHRAVVRPPEPPSVVSVLVLITLAPYTAAAPASAPPSAVQHLDVVAGGHRLASFDLHAGYQTVSLTVPSQLSNVPLELDFAYAGAPAASGGSIDSRELAAAVDWISFTYL